MRWSFEIAVRVLNSLGLLRRCFECRALGLGLRSCLNTVFRTYSRENGATGAAASRFRFGERQVLIERLTALSALLRGEKSSACLYRLLEFVSIVFLIAVYFLSLNFCPWGKWSDVTVSRLRPPIVDYQHLGFDPPYGNRRKSRAELSY